MTNQTREAISLQRAAFLLDVHEDTLRRWWKSGRLVIVRIGPKLLRVPKSEIARLRVERGEFHPHMSA